MVALCKNFRVISELPTEALFILCSFFFIASKHNIFSSNENGILLEKRTKVRTNLFSIIIGKQLLTESIISVKFSASQPGIYSLAKLKSGRVFLKLAP